MIQSNWNWGREAPGRQGHKGSQSGGSGLLYAHTKLKEEQELVRREGRGLVEGTVEGNASRGRQHGLGRSEAVWASGMMLRQSCRK